MDKRFWDRLGRAIAIARHIHAPLVSAGYVPPAPGLAYARFVGYFELGKHEEDVRGELVLVDKVDLVFELSGPNHQPRKMDDGTLIPHRITVQETLSFSDRANFFKLFTAMNAAHGGTATHMAQLLGKPFIVEVFHRKSADGTKTYANLKGPDGYNVTGLRSIDGDDTPALRPHEIPLLTAPMFFIWDAADKEMWDSLYIPGFYEERKDDKGNVISPKRSKNVLQERIMKAKNWPEHPLAVIAALPEASPEAERLARKLAEQREAEFKEWQAGNVRKLKDAASRVVPDKMPAKKRPPKSN
ncbi:hypothetical protein [Paraburkholderia caledonica]|uniref:hypothetical protein n=1 Tax=Paraburkholderia caledonica TaxID=134536 RepID=UPI0012601EDA|nr:hypothetical protein [Paraburkholderia caledonica]